MISRHYGVHMFLGYHYRPFGKQCLQHSLALFVPSPKCFIREQISTGPKVGVEVASEVIGMADLKAVRTINSPDRSQPQSFARTLFTSQHKRCFWKVGRILEAPSGPADDVVGHHWIAAAENFLNMLTQQRQLASLGDDAPAPPEVHPTPSLIAGDYGWLSRLKHHSSIIGSVGTSKPPLAPSEWFTISLHPNGPIGIAIDEIAPALKHRDH